MEPGILPLAPPAGGVWRVARTSTRPFAPPSWTFADPESCTFGGRFDDPTPSRARFRIVYAASTPAGAFAEVLAPFRPSLSLMSEMDAVGLSGGAALAKGTGHIPEPWRLMRSLDHGQLAPDLRFVDISAASTLAWLRQQPRLARLAAHLGLPDIDLAAVTGPVRPFTQACSAALHAVPDRSFAGIRYLSRHGADEGRECWAIFDDRIAFVGTPERIAIDREHPDLIAVAEQFHLSMQ